jgi:hypothetical protein
MKAKTLTKRIRNIQQTRNEKNKEERYIIVQEANCHSFFFCTHTTYIKQPVISKPNEHYLFTPEIQRREATIFFLCNSPLHLVPATDAWLEGVTACRNCLATANYLQHSFCECGPLCEIFRNIHITPTSNNLHPAERTAAARSKFCTLPNS